LGRLDRLARRPDVIALALRLEDRGRRRSIEVRTADGATRTFRLGAFGSYVDLLDKVAEFLESGEREETQHGGE
jgi:hypothetical protein